METVTRIYILKKPTVPVTILRPISHLKIYFSVKDSRVTTYLMKNNKYVDKSVQTIFRICGTC